ncbi:MAG: PEGA domain-containing protein [Candidatus Aminicenantes bacterium]|nr:PEGA domain-containing protein [Candidatus Aminicenantes bacterium]
MIIKRKKQIISALIVTSVFLFQSCLTISSGFRTSQKIPVTSNPSGARIIVDGKEVGNAPLELKLEKRKNHTIRIEKQGYNPLEIKITRKIQGLLPSIFINFLTGGGFIPIIPAFF